MCLLYSKADWRIGKSAEKLNSADSTLSYKLYFCLFWCLFLSCLTYGFSKIAKTSKWTRNRQVIDSFWKVFDKTDYLFLSVRTVCLRRFVLFGSSLVCDQIVMIPLKSITVISERWWIKKPTCKRAEHSEQFRTKAVWSRTEQRGNKRGEEKHTRKCAIFWCAIV